jgi:hypothetical protein
MPWMRHYPNTYDKLLLAIPFILTKLSFLNLNTFLKIVKNMNYNAAFCVRILEIYFHYKHKDAVKIVYLSIFTND